MPIDWSKAVVTGGSAADDLHNDFRLGRERVVTHTILDVSNIGATTVHPGSQQARVELVGSGRAEWVFRDGPLFKTQVQPGYSRESVSKYSYKVVAIDEDGKEEERRFEYWIGEARKEDVPPPPPPPPPDDDREKLERIRNSCILSIASSESSIRHNQEAIRLVDDLLKE